MKHEKYQEITKKAVKRFYEDLAEEEGVEFDAEMISSAIHSAVDVEDYDKAIELTEDEYFRFVYDYHDDQKHEIMEGYYEKLEKNDYSL